MEWIACSERMPGSDIEDVQVYCSDTKEQLVGFHIGDGQFQYAIYDDIRIACTPTHWALLPAPPAE